jgi:hypothetical protein
MNLLWAKGVKVKIHAFLASVLDRVECQLHVRAAGTLDRGMNVLQGCRIQTALHY